MTAIGRARDLGRPALLVIESAGADGADAGCGPAAAGELEPGRSSCCSPRTSPRARRASTEPPRSRSARSTSTRWRPSRRPTRRRVPADVPALICSSAAAAFLARSTPSRAPGRAGQARSRGRGARPSARRRAATSCARPSRGSPARSPSCRRPRERAERPARRARRVVCPFKGLASFDAADAAYFFGRERLVAELVARLVGAPLLGCRRAVGQRQVLGRAGGAAAPRSPAACCRAARSGRRRAAPRRAPDARCCAAATVGAAPGERAVLIAVDQFEEVFTLCRDEAERAAFIDALVAAAGDRRTASGVVVLARPRRLLRPLRRVPGAGGAARGQPRARRADAARRAAPRDRTARRSAPDWTSSRELVDALLADIDGRARARSRCSRPRCSSSGNAATATACACAAYERTGGVRGAVGAARRDGLQRLDAEQQTHRATHPAAPGRRRRRSARPCAGGSPLAELEADRDDQSRHVLERAEPTAVW